MSLTSNIETLTQWLLRDSHCDTDYLDLILKNGSDLKLKFGALPGSPVAFVGKAVLYAVRYWKSDEDYLTMLDTLGGKTLDNESGDEWWNSNNDLQRILLLADADGRNRGRNDKLTEKEKDVAYRELEMLELSIRSLLPKGELQSIHPRFKHSSLVGGADAGLVVDHTLWQTRTISGGLSISHIAQSLLYTLLDMDDRHKIRAIGLMLPRQDVCVELEINSLFKGQALSQTRSLFYTYLKDNPL